MEASDLPGVGGPALHPDLQRDGPSWGVAATVSQELGPLGVLRRSGGGRGRTSSVNTVQSQVENFTLPVSTGGIFGLLFQSNVSELWTVFPSSQRILLGRGVGAWKNNSVRLRENGLSLGDLCILEKTQTV